MSGRRVTLNAAGGVRFTAELPVDDDDDFPSVVCAFDPRDQGVPHRAVFFAPTVFEKDGRREYEQIEIVNARNVEVVQ